jgi:hypothetical protein
VLAIPALLTAGHNCSQIPCSSGDTRNFHRVGGRYVTLVSSNPLFHRPQDRWPDAVHTVATLPSRGEQSNREQPEATRPAPKLIGHLDRGGFRSLPTLGDADINTLALVQIHDARPLKRGGVHKDILAAAI